MESFLGLNKVTKIIFIVLLVGLVSLLRYVDDGDEYTYEYLQTSSEVTKMIGEIEKLGLRRILSAQDYKTGLFFKEYTYSVSGKKAKANVRIRLYYEESQKKSNDDIVKVSIERIKVIE